MILSNATAGVASLPALLPAGTARVASSPRPPLHLAVQPTADAAASGLAATAGRLAESLAADPDRDVVVHLAPGVHRVPSGGLALTAAHSPSAGRTVRWLGRGAASVSSAVPVTGWALANEPGLPAGAMAAPSPLQDGGVRHLWVGGRRAACTRVAAALTLPGGLNLTADGSGYSCSAAAAAAGWVNPGEVEFVYSGVGQAWSGQIGHDRRHCHIS